MIPVVVLCVCVCFVVSNIERATGNWTYSNNFSFIHLSFPSLLHVFLFLWINCFLLLGERVSICKKCVTQLIFFRFFFFIEFYTKMANTRNGSNCIITTKFDLKKTSWLNRMKEKTSKWIGCLWPWSLNLFLLLSEFEFVYFFACVPMRKIAILFTWFFFVFIWIKCTTNATSMNFLFITRHCCFHLMAQSLDYGFFAFKKEKEQKIQRPYNTWPRWFFFIFFSSIWPTPFLLFIYPDETVAIAVCATNFINFYQI